MKGRKVRPLMSDSGISWDLMEEEFYKGKRIVGLNGRRF